MTKLRQPLEKKISELKYNNTLHGRSVYRKTSVPGHNVFLGYTARNGDGLDLYTKAGSPVFAMSAGTVEVMEPSGRNGRVLIRNTEYRIMYAHVHVVSPSIKVGATVKAGQCIGYVGRFLRAPHLHLEVWHNGMAVSGNTPKKLAENIENLI